MDPPPPAHQFRNYKGTDAAPSSPDAGVYQHYRQMRTRQCVDFSARVGPSVYSFRNRRMSIRDAFDALRSFVDRSDPDTLLPNQIHMLQAAEAARAAGEPDWMIVTALIHDMGKAMFLWGDPSEGFSGLADGDQSCLGGDTWVLGCAIPQSAVFPDLNALNPDAAHPIYGTEQGCYKDGCGMMSLDYAVGHGGWRARESVRWVRERELSR